MEVVHDMPIVAKLTPSNCSLMNRLIDINAIYCGMAASLGTPRSCNSINAKYLRSLIATCLRLSGGISESVCCYTLSGRVPLDSVQIAAWLDPVESPIRCSRLVASKRLHISGWVGETYVRLRDRMRRWFDVHCVAR